MSNIATGLTAPTDESVHVHQCNEIWERILSSMGGNSVATYTIRKKHQVVITYTKSIIQIQDEPFVRRLLQPPVQFSLARFSNVSFSEIPQPQSVLPGPGEVRLGGLNQAYSRLSTTHGHITDCKLDSVVYAVVCVWFNVDCLVWVERSTSDNFRVPSYRFSSATGEQKGIIQTIYTDSEPPSRLPNSLMPNAKLRSANLPFFTSFCVTWSGIEPRPPAPQADALTTVLRGGGERLGWEMSSVDWGWTVSAGKLMSIMTDLQLARQKFWKVVCCEKKTERVNPTQTLVFSLLWDFVRSVQWTSSDYLLASLPLGGRKCMVVQGPYPCSSQVAVPWCGWLLGPSVELPHIYDHVLNAAPPNGRDANFWTFCQGPSFMPKYGNFEIGPYLGNHCP